MGLFSALFKKKPPPEPYEWAFLRRACLQAISSRVVSAELAKSQLDELDFDRLSASGEDEEEVVMEIYAALKHAKTPELSESQAQAYLYHAAEMLRSDVGASEAVSRLNAIEASLRRS